MNRRQTDNFTHMVFMMSFVVGVLGGGIAYSQTPGGDTPPDPPPTVQEEPMVSEDQGEVIERAIRPGYPRRLPGLLPPKATAPSAPAPKVFAPSVGGPSAGSTLSKGDRYTAPTPSLTAIRNAIRVTSKSVSVNLRIPPNLPVTVPVEISVAYISSAQTQRQTKTYSPASGLTLLYREAEGNGEPRAMTVDITVRELIPNGKSFAVSKQLTIIPLYQATVSPLKFNMATQCDTVGKSDITFHWIYFDGKHRELKFDLGLGETKKINHFNSIRREFSTEDNLKEPVMQFYERDLGYEYYPPIDQPVIPLAPGPTKEFRFMLKEGKTGPPGSPFGTSGCRANISYRIDRSLMTFDQF